MHNTYLKASAELMHYIWYMAHVHWIIFTLHKGKDGPKLFNHAFHEGLLAKLNVKLCTSKDWPGAVHPGSLKKHTPTKT